MAEERELTEASDLVPNQQDQDSQQSAAHGDEAREPDQAEAIQHSTLREYFITIVVCVIFALFVTTFVVHPMTVPTPSMVPTILVGDRLLIDKFSYRNHFREGLGLAASRLIERGDVVVFKYPQDPQVLYVKRAIGLPGETVEIRDKQVFIDNQPIDEPYKYHSEGDVRTGGFHSFSSRDNFGPLTVPQGQYFVMGDNRDDSRDSRYFGTLEESMIVGRPLFVFWSYEDDADAYQRSSPSELVKLYGERIIYFFTRTRWSRFGHVIR
ncbi:MAG TPA: signal peptidase I [Acidobacteriota bacterium]|nr:signal peptidase I [Acidobacteriota bacterium]